MKKFKSKFIALPLLALSLTFIPAKQASAATYETFLERGVKYLSWSKATISWTANSTSITSSDTWQQRSGLFVELNGITKLNKSTNLAHYYHSYTTFLVGAEIAGVTLGHAIDVTDEAYITRSGWSQWDPGI